VVGNRLWFVTNRCEVVCLDAEGFRDGENDGLLQDEIHVGKNEADIVWRFDLIASLDVTPRFLTSTSPTVVDGIVLVGTSNGIDSSRMNQEAWPPANPTVPSFIALEADTGRLLWQDSSPGANILNGQWSSPAYGVIHGVPQAIFAGGDGWLYSFDFRELINGRTNLLWKFDCNPKTSFWIIGGRGRRNSIIATPVIHENLVYIVTGQSPEHHEGEADLWCIDPTKRGDISAQLVFNKSDPRKRVSQRRFQACDPEQGDFVKPNPNTGVVWQFDKHDQNGDGRITYDEQMNRAVATPSISQGLLVIPDYSGVVHCLDAKSGKLFWQYELSANVTSSPLVADGKIYVADMDGDLAIFRLSHELELINRIPCGRGVAGTLIAAGNTLYVPAHSTLFAISRNGEQGGRSEN